MEVRAVVGIGIELDLPYLEAEVRVPGRAEPEIRVYSLRLVRPDVTFPIDTVITGLNFWIEILEPRLRVERLVVEDGLVGTLAAPWQAPGRWLWRMRGVDMVAEDIRLGGRAQGLGEGFRIVRASTVGEIRSRPISIRDFVLDVERDGVFTADGTVRLPETLVDADFLADRRNDWLVTLDADTFAFQDLIAFIPQLERAAPGGGEGVVTLAGGPDLQSADVARLHMASGRSFVTARGLVAVEDPEPRFSDVVVEADPVHAEDVERVFGIAIPGGGVWTGWLAGDGTFREGVDLRAAFARRDDAGRLSRFTVNGTAILEPDPVLDLAVRADPLRAADTAFVATLDLVGPADSLAITGEAMVVGIPDIAARLDARLLDRPASPPTLTGAAVVTAERAAVQRLAGVPETTGPAEPVQPPPGPPAPDLLGVPLATAPTPARAPGLEAVPAPPPSPLVARATGSVVLAEDGPADVTITADSLPLALVPWPEAVDSVRGVARGSARIGGTVDAPVVTGRASLEDGAFFIEPLAMPVEEIEGAARLTDGLLVVDTLGARAGGGDIVVTGTVRLFEGPRRFDLALRADSVTVKDDAEGDVTASADLALTGPFDRPSLTGRVYDVHGWIREDAFREDPVLDLDDPPYADLARRAPWPEDSELLARAEPEEPPPAVVRVAIEVDTTLHVVDEDSDLYGWGGVIVLTTDTAVEARGLAEIEGGFYAFFGERFTVIGGTARFEGPVEPYIAIKAEHEENWAIGDGRIATATALPIFPPLEFLAIGPAARPDERITRWSLLPETQADLAALLIFGIEPQPVREWRRTPVWRPSDPGDFIDVRSKTQAATLAWSYIADEAYDYLPLERGWLQSGTVVTGPGYPAPVVVGPMLGAGAIFDGFEVFVTQALDGQLIPGVRVRANGFAPFGARLEAFSIPRFYPETPAGNGHPGFFTRRKTGAGLFWEWEFGKGGGDLTRPASRESPPPR